MKIVKISSKNQITLPASMLQSFDIYPRQQVLIEKRADEIVIKPLKKSIVDEVAGSLEKYIPPSKKGIPFSKVLEETKKIAARELAKEGLDE